MNSHGLGLPAQPLIERFIAWCVADERILAAFLGGSYARQEADDYSDLDLCVITTDEAHEEVVAARAAIVQQLGTPLFLEDFDLDGIVFFILDDGTEAELFFGCASRLHEISDVGPFRTLVDKVGILEGARFPWREPDPADQREALRRCIDWFWHELSHFIAAMGRGQLWWAFGQLEALRGICINLTRIEQNVGAQDEMYEKLDHVISTHELAALELTFCAMEKHAMLRAVGDIVDFFRARAPAVAEAYGSTYPTELEALMCERFADLVQASHSQVEDFWRSFVEATGIDRPYTAWGFGNDPTMADALGLLVRDGPKRATTSLLSWHEEDDAEPMPSVGDLSVVLDGRGNPICVIRTVSVEVRAFGLVDEAFAWVEGEGDRSLAHWREAHIRFFASEGRPVDDRTLLVLDTFELLWSPEH